ncbi:MAG: hypothetical protein HY000_22325 [Planctomycetes bacterium]|nr:hypothetical protein [Planctomycetota bacterium]
MSMYPPQLPPLYFLHIGKTGGTTLTAMLDPLFDPAKICPAQILPDLLRLPDQQLTRYRFFRGHFGSALPELLRSPVTTITLLREPPAQVISCFLHIQRSPAHWLYPRVVGRKMSLLDFLCDDESAPAVWNNQCRNLAARLDVARFSSLPPDELRAIPLGRELDRAVAHLDQQARLDRALEQLDRCAAFGLTEQMSDTLRLLATTLGFQPASALLVLNQSPHRIAWDDLTPQTQERLHEVTRLDAELYASARRRFEDRCRMLFDGVQGRNSRQAA